MLMNELFSEARPWSHIQTNWNSEIHNRVDKGERPLLNFSHEEYPHKDAIVKIIQACWQTDPNQRPTMAVALKEIENLIDAIENVPQFLPAAGRNSVQSRNIQVGAARPGSPHSSQSGQQGQPPFSSSHSSPYLSNPNPNNQQYPPGGQMYSTNPHPGGYPAQQQFAPAPYSSGYPQAQRGASAGSFNPAPPGYNPQANYGSGYPMNYNDPTHSATVSMRGGVLPAQPQVQINDDVLTKIIQTVNSAGVCSLSILYLPLSLF